MRWLGNERPGDRQLRAMLIGFAHELQKLAVPGFRRCSITGELRGPGGAEQTPGPAGFPEQRGSICGASFRVASRGQEHVT